MCDPFLPQTCHAEKEPPIDDGSWSIEGLLTDIGRDGEIRTRDLTHPKRARYQAAPRPVNTDSVWSEIVLCQTKRARLFALTAQTFKLCVTLIEQVKHSL